MSAAVQETLKQLGMQGLLTNTPEEGGAQYLLCDMDECYSPRGRGYFDPISRDSQGRLLDWMPSEEHWPIGQAEDGLRVKGNLWLAHRLCNDLGFGVGPGYDKRRSSAKARMQEWSTTNEADFLSTFGNRQAAEAWWVEHSPRRAAYP